MDGRLWHGDGVNSTAEARLALFYSCKEWHLLRGLLWLERIQCEKFVCAAVRLWPAVSCLREPPAVDAPGVISPLLCCCLCCCRSNMISWVCTQSQEVIAELPPLVRSILGFRSWFGCECGIAPV